MVLKNLSFLKTLIYADIFDYPLKKEEIHKWLIKETKDKTGNKYKIEHSDGYYFLPGRQKITAIRKKREEWSKAKLIFAQKAVSILKYIPSIKFIAITGALSMNNVKEDDDIDLFIISRKGFIWTTRFLSVLFMEIMGMRRRPGQKNTKDKICLNMFMDETHFSIPNEEKDLFSAHEILQMIPLYDKDSTYNSFLVNNSWVKDFLPNAFNIFKKRKHKKEFEQSWNPLEEILKNIQLWYMEGRRTGEVIKDGYLRFHPVDIRQKVLFNYRKKIKEVSITS